MTDVKPLLLALLLCALPQTSAAGISRVFQADGGLSGPSALLGSLELDAGRCDYDGDGFAELCYKVGPRNLIVSKLDGMQLLVYNPSIQDFCPACNDSGSWNLYMMGFAEIDPTASGRELVVVWETSSPPYLLGTAIVNPASSQMLANGPYSCYPADVVDIDGNGLSEVLLVCNEGFEVWGYTTATGIEPPIATSDGESDILQFRAYPNPLNHTAIIEFEIATASLASCAIFNIEGRTIRSLGSVYVTPGRQQLIWDGRDTDGREVSPGVYFSELVIGERKGVRRLVVLR